MNDIEKGAIPSEVVEKSSTLHTASFTPHPQGSGLSEEKQIEEMWNIITTDCNEECVGCEFENDNWCFTHRVINNLYNAGYRKQEWISVDERLPEDTLPTDYKHKTIKVLVAIKAKNGVTIRTQQRFLDYTYRDDKRTALWTWRFSGGDVTHWMPLPEAPKMKGGAG
jgi:hypothetical protein